MCTKYTFHVCDMKQFYSIIYNVVNEMQPLAGTHIIPRFCKQYSLGCITFKTIFIFFICLSSFNAAAQLSVTYTQQTGNYYSVFNSGTSGSYNQGAFQLGMYAHGAAPKQTVAWRKFRTDASGSSTGNRAMQIGDQFTITLSATRAYGKIGFALLASPATGSFANRESNYALSVNLDGPTYAGVGTWGVWYLKYAGGATAPSSFGGLQTTYKNFTFILTLTANDRMNVTMTDGSNTSNFYDIQLNTSNPITDYSVYLEDDYDGDQNRDIYWGLGAVGQQHLLTNTGFSTIGQSNNSFTVSSVINNGLDANSATSNLLNNNLVKSGSGNLILGSTNTYRGTTTINNGALVVASLANGGLASSIGQSSSASANVVLNGGILQYNGTTTSTDRGLTLSAGITGTIHILSVATTLTISGNIANTNGALTKAGSGSLILSGNNLFTGGINVNAGSLVAGSTGAFNSSVANAVSVNGGTLSINGFNTTIGALSGTSGTVNNGNTGAAILTVNTSSVTDFAGNMTDGIIGGSLALVKNGTGTISLSGVNNYTGITTLAAGTVTINSAAGLSQNSDLHFTGGNLSIGTVTSGAVLNAGKINFQNNANVDLGSGSTSFTLNFANSSAEAWSSAATITIYNWTPSAGKIINIAGAGLTAAQLARINFDNYGFGAKLVGNELRPYLLYITKASGTGNYTTATSWLLNDMPLLNDGTESIYIQPGFSLYMTVSLPAIRLMRAEVGGILVMNTGGNITIYPGGDFRIAGSVSMTASSVINMSAGISMIAQSASANFSPAGILNFLGAFSINSNAPNAVLLPNVNLNASVDFGQNSTIQSGSSLTILAGGFVNNNAPFYDIGANLVYNTGGNYNRSTEWSSSSGRGYPYNVRVASTTLFNLSNGTPGIARQIAGSLTVDAGRVFTMQEGAGMYAPLIVLGNVDVEGELRLGNAIGGDIKVGGHYTVGATGNVMNNSRAVFFTGTADQLITKMGGGIIYFDFIVVNKPTGIVKMASSTNAYLISLVNNDPSARVLQLVSGDIDMNGGIMTLQGDYENSLNIYVDGGSARKIFTSTGFGEFRITGSSTVGVAKLSVTAGAPGSKLLFDNNVLVTTNVGVNFGAAGITTINAQLRIDQNGYVLTNSPDYGPSATLIYNNGAGGYKRNMEWNTYIPGVTGAGYPNNVVVQNNTAVDLNSTDFPATFPLGCSGKFTIMSGSSVTTGAMAYPLLIGENIDIDGTLTLSTDTLGDLSIGGVWNRTGTFIQNNRMVIFDSTNDASIKGLGGQVFSRLTINKKSPAASISIDSTVFITNELFLQRGSVTLNRDIVLLSDNVRTARIGETMQPGDISIHYNDGKFNIHRFLPLQNTSASRRWRLLSPPVKSNNAPTINASWQEGQTSLNRLSPVNAFPGFGTPITKMTSAINGFDQGSTINPSIYSYNTITNGWEAPAATNTGKITDQPGYMLFVRGDRSIVVSSSAVPGVSTTLRTRGEVNIGDVNVKLNPSGFQVVGNPYASAIGFNNVVFNNVSPASTAGKSFYLWDPKLGGENNVGGWVTFTSLGNGTYAVSGNISGYSNTGIIESGAAMLLPVSGGDFLFQEKAKIAASSTLGIASRPVSNLEFFSCELFSINGQVVRMTDGVVSVGHPDFDDRVTDKDAYKLISFSSTEKISIAKNGQKLSIELKKRISAGDTIFYQLTKLSPKNYQLYFKGQHIDNTLVGFIQDKYLQTEQAINAADTSTFRFAVTADTLSSAPDRFRVVFKPAVKYGGIKATAINNDIAVNWKVSSEFMMDKYELERSKDGVVFETVAIQLSKGNSNNPVVYNWIDKSLDPAVYFYRVKGIAQFGGVVHSEIITANIYHSSTVVYVFPNPVTDNNAQLYMASEKPGIYGIRLFNSNGQLLLKTSINHKDGVAAENIKLPATLLKGAYQLELTDNKKQRTITGVVIQ